MFHRTGGREPSHAHSDLRISACCVIAQVPSTPLLNSAGALTLRLLPVQPGGAGCGNRGAPGSRSIASAFVT